MVKLQMELSKKANYIVSVFKAKNRLNTKAEAVNEIIEQHGGVD